MTLPAPLSPSPRRPGKRPFIEAFHTSETTTVDRGPDSKRLRQDLSVFSWLDTIPRKDRSRSVPAILDYSDYPPPFLFRSRVPCYVESMADHNSKNEKDNASQTTSKSVASTIKTSNLGYRAVLEYNHVEIDETGLQMEKDLQDMMQDTVLKQRSSPPLPQDELDMTVANMIEWGRSPESIVSNVMGSAMFPVRRKGLSHGGNTPWPKTALPFEPEYGFAISAPKPDYHVGYALGRVSGFSAQEKRVLDHPKARHYTQPGTGNVLPFLVVELKSEATGGTLFHAEHQAAGSGSYIVNAMRWLFSEAKVQAKVTDCIAFSLAATGRQAVLYTHWYSPEKDTFYASYVKSFATADRQDVQACHNAIKNILDWALGSRYTKIQSTLKALLPRSQQWSKRSHSAVSKDGVDNDTGSQARDVEETESEYSTSIHHSQSSRTNSQMGRRLSAPTELADSSQFSPAGRSPRTGDTSVTKKSVSGTASSKKG